VQVFNAVGAPLGKFLWERSSRLVGFSWVEDEARRLVSRAPPLA
jgi:hypothetical protein